MKRKSFAKTYIKKIQITSNNLFILQIIHQASYEEILGYF